MYDISRYTKTVKAQENRFTGTVCVSIITNANEEYKMSSRMLIFEPKSRTNWHSHKNGQVLIITKGIGYYQEEGKPIQEIMSGDVVKIPKGAIHWHGASHQVPMSLIEIVSGAGDGSTMWLDPVTDQQYNTLLTPETKIDFTAKAFDNYNELWQTDLLKLWETDSELAEIFYNFLLDDLREHGNLDINSILIVTLASNIAGQGTIQYEETIRAALNVGVSPGEIKEVLYQSVPYVGMAQARQFIEVTNNIFKEEGIQLPLHGKSTTNRDSRFEEGLAVQKSIFGEGIDKMRENAPEGQEHIQEYITVNCFGDYYAREGLNISERELVTYSILISMNGTDSQVREHIQGNANVGNDKQTLVEVTTQLLPYIGYPRTLNALKAINEVLTE